MAHLLIRFISVLLLIGTAGMAAAQAPYRAQAGDTLNIEVLEDPSLNRSVVILPDGRFSFPFAGTLPGSNRTVSEIQASISAAIASNFAAPPTVFVSAQPKAKPPVKSGPAIAATIDIYVMGEVDSPGKREVSPGTTFLQAMAQAGTLTKFAATKRIQLRRTNPTTGQQTVSKFNYKAIGDGAVLVQDPKLRDGDIILVPSRRLFE